MSRPSDGIRIGPTRKYSVHREPPGRISYTSWEMQNARFRQLLDSVARLLSLTLADLGGVRERILHTLLDVLRNFDTVSARPGHERNLMRPYFAAHRGDGVAEGREGLWIPCSGSDLEFPSFGEVVCE